MSRRVFLTGEPKLLAEFGESCHAGGFSVGGRPNIAGRLPGFIKKGKISGTTLGVELTNSDLAAKKTNLQYLDRSISPSGMILSSSVTVTAAEQAGWMRGPSRLIGISALPALTAHKLVEIAPTRQTR